MEKYTLLTSIQECVEACENLATACTHAEKKMCQDCMTIALDCADAGMILIMKLSADHELHRNLVKQFAHYCRECIAACDKYNNDCARGTLQACKTTLEACESYISEHVHADQYYFVPDTSSRVYTHKWKHLLTR